MESAEEPALVENDEEPAAEGTGSLRRPGIEECEEAGEDGCGEAIEVLEPKM